jgi:two-component system NarL family sensor kinase
MIDAPLEKVLGLPFSSFLAVRDAESFRQFFRLALRRKNTLETTLVRRDESEVNVHLSANTLALQNARGICLVITDISQRKAIDDARRHLAKSIIQAQERERQRVAVELHDGINQLLASTKHRIHGIEQRLNGHGGELHEDVVQTRKLLERTIQEVRLISRNLRPSELDDLGLLAAIRTLASEFGVRSGIKVELNLRPLSRALSPEIELTIYRIFQEALTNVERHSEATAVSILLTQTSRNVQLVIRDDGRGFDPATAGKSRFGLANMYERASHVDGKCAIDSSPTEGTTIRLRIPIPL